MVTESGGGWVFLTYRLPREPSGPRLALWRAIRRLGALQVGDGLVALPRSARTLEHAQWLAADIREHAGTASVWHAQADSGRDHAAFAATMQAAVDEEYRAILGEAEAAATGGDLVSRRRAARRLRGQLRRVALRDYFEAPAGAGARRAVDRLARSAEAVPA